MAFFLHGITKPLNIWWRRLNKLRPIWWIGSICTASVFTCVWVGQLSSWGCLKSTFSLPASFPSIVHLPWRKPMIYEANKFVNEHTPLQLATPQTCWWETKRAERAVYSLLAQITDIYTCVSEEAESFLVSFTSPLKDEIKSSLKPKKHPGTGAKAHYSLNAGVKEETFFKMG